MSRIRSIHPGLWTDEQFVSLSAFARLLFMGIWNECDDKGTFAWSPLQMKMRLLPADNVDAAELMAELVAADCIKAYEIEGKRFGAVRNFAKFQRPKSPNDIHPATAEVLAFAGHPTEIEATKPTLLPKHSPNPSEIVPQMEEGEEEIKEEEVSPSGDCASADALAPEHIQEKWNETARRIARPTILRLTPERRQLLKGRIAQYTIDEFVTVFGKVERSGFLRGDTKWQGVTFDWLFKKANFQKVLEGNYDG